MTTPYATLLPTSPGAAGKENMLSATLLLISNIVILATLWIARICMWIVTIPFVLIAFIAGIVMGYATRDTTKR